MEARVRDVVGLYLSPPENAVVTCVERHRHQEFLKFLKQVAREYPWLHTLHAASPT